MSERSGRGARGRGRRAGVHDAERRARRLRDAIRSARRRYRLRALLQGGAILVGAGLVLLVGSAFLIDRLRFDPTAVLGLRIGVWVALAGVAGWFLVRPLLRRLPDARVALYLEEHEPSLETSLLTAVESPAIGSADADARALDADPLARGLLETAWERLRAAEEGRGVERPRLRRAGGWLAAVSFAAFVAFALGPGWLGEAGPLVLAPWRSAEAASPYSVQVEPGDARVPRGADQKLVAMTRGFEAEAVEAVVRRGEGAWERMAMLPAPEGAGFELLLFDLRESTEYLVEAEGVRSPIYRIEVVDVPYVDRIDLEYRFPEYTGLEPRIVEDGGDIAALRGTRVTLRVTPTVPVAAGDVIFDPEDGEPERLQLAPRGDGVLESTLLVERPGFYRVRLQGPDEEPVIASPEYRVEPLDDQPPLVSIREPGRDLRPTSIEEVYIEVEAEDDHAVGAVELLYTVNGGEERSVRLYGGGRATFSGGHTFFLEELGLEPGDLVSYWARAADRNRVTGPGSATSDIYFLAIRPFDREFRQADQMPGPGGGSGLGGALSEQQRQIIAATFNLLRDREDRNADAVSEDLTTLALLQGRLREEVERLLEQMRQRGVAADSAFRTVADELPLAAEAMSEAETRLGQEEPREALSPEQRALQHLQRAEAAFREVQIALGGGGGGGAGGAPAEDLADLFELELDRLRNQYETVERGERRQREEAVDEALQRLRELARRQEQLNERARRGMPSGARSGGGGAAQQRLIEETEELARRLERLSREDRDPELAASARRLQEAADRMRRASGSPTESGDEALQRLRQARRQLEARREAGLARGVEDARERARRIVERQRELGRDVERALQEDGPPDPERAARLSEAKDRLAGQVASLETDLDRLARESRGDRPEVSRRLSEAAGGIRDDKLREKILYSRGLLDGRSPDYARRFEEEIQANAEELAEAVEDAARTLAEGEARDLGRRLEEARDLVRGLESLRERIRERAERAASGETGQAGERGRQGEPARQGQGGRQGQDGQRGQAGQQGQAGGGGQAGGETPARSGGPGPGGSGSGRIAPDRARQFQHEFRQRRAEAERLRRELEAAGIDADALAAAIARLQELEAARTYEDRAEIERLQAAVIRGLKEFEFALRRDLLGPQERRLFLSGSDEVPEGYRELVEAYYRSLAEDPPR